MNIYEEYEYKWILPKCHPKLPKPKDLRLYWRLSRCKLHHWTRAVQGVWKGSRLSPHVLTPHRVEHSEVWSLESLAISFWKWPLDHSCVGPVASSLSGFAEAARNSCEQNSEFFAARSGSELKDLIPGASGPSAFSLTLEVNKGWIKAEKRLNKLDSLNNIWKFPSSFCTALKASRSDGSWSTSPPCLVKWTAKSMRKQNRQRSGAPSLLQLMALQSLFSQQLSSGFHPHCLQRHIPARRSFNFGASSIPDILTMKQKFHEVPMESSTSFPFTLSSHWVHSVSPQSQWRSPRTALWPTAAGARARSFAAAIVKVS